MSRLPPWKPPRNFWWGVSILLIGIIAVIAVIILVYHAQIAALRTAQTANIAAHVADKTRQLDRFRDERIDDAKAIAEQAFFDDAYATWLDAPTPAIGEKLVQSLAAINTQHFTDIVLFDQSGQERMRLYPERLYVPCAATRALLARTLAAGTAQFGDIYRCSPTALPQWEVAVPLLVTQNGAPVPVGVALLAVDVPNALFSLLNEWPVESASEKTHIVERQGDEVVVLDPSGTDPPALAAHWPITRTDLPVVQALLREQGTTVGRDARAVDVLAAYAPVPDSPWRVVATMDLAEVEAPGTGRFGWVLVAVVGVLALGGILIAVLGLYPRRTTLRRLDNAERDRDFLSAIVESSADAIIGLDAHGKILTWNAGAQRMYGYSADEMIGQPVTRLTLPALHEEMQRFFDEAARGHVVETFDAQVLAKDNRLIAAAVSTFPVRNAAGQIVGIGSIARDVSERKRFEQQLRDSEERFRLIVQNSPNIITLWDSSGTMRYISPAAERVFGLPAAELLRRLADPPGDQDTGPLAQPATFGIGPEEAAALAQIMAAVAYCLAHPGEIKRVEHRVRTMSGDYRDLDAVYQGFVHSVSGCEVLSISSDITEFRALARMLQDSNAELEGRVAARTAQLAAAMEELTRAAQMKDEFMSAVSHELRTPLTGVLGMAEALEEQYAGPLNERQIRYVHTIRRSGNRLLALINRILHYTALVGGQVTVHSDTCYLGELGANAIRAARPPAEAKGQTLQFNIDPPELTIICDSNSIAQVLEQLLDNAVKFTPAGGQVGLEIRGDDAAGCVRLVVWDTGIGISAAQRATIFQPFVQVDASLARQYEGIGLGLPFVQRMVELLGGTITVESELGQGSRFTVTLALR